ncbi:hypothetical protein OROHE_006637 [Orobanche hederae]
MAPSLTDLPPATLVEILVRLPLKTLFRSSSVCKFFLSLTLPNPHFIDLHSTNAAPVLAFQFGGLYGYTPSSVLRLAEPEVDIAPAFGQKFDPKPLLELPNNYWEDNDFGLVNSCNGLIYLARRSFHDEHSLVCNLITNEYVIIPDVDKESRLDSRTECTWLGFSPGSNQYKVLRIFTSLNSEPAKIAAQVFVIGSNSHSWRGIDSAPLGSDHWWNLRWTFFNGIMYWFEFRWVAIVFFDFEREMFGEIALPPGPGEEGWLNTHLMDIGVIGGCLSMTFDDIHAWHVDVWVMTRKCGNQESWSKEFVIDTAGVDPRGGYVYGQFKPLQVLRNGEMLMLWVGQGFVCYDPRSKSLRFVGVDGMRLTTYVVAFTPSFIPLRDTFKVDKVLKMKRLGQRAD